MGGVDSAFNSWDLGIVPMTSDFVSVMDTGSMGARQADGTLPVLDFMRPRTGSALIDKGTPVALPYVGGAPDLGAFEDGADDAGSREGDAGRASTAADSGASVGSVPTNDGGGDSAAPADAGGAGRARDASEPDTTARVGGASASSEAGALDGETDPEPAEGRHGCAVASSHAAGYRQFTLAYLLVAFTLRRRLTRSRARSRVASC